MITIDTLVTAKKQYVINNIMPSDLDSNIEAGLKKKEAILAGINDETIIQGNPNIDEIINTLNEQGLTEEQCIQFIMGDTNIIDFQKVPESPDIGRIRYCIDDGELQTYKSLTEIQIEIPQEEDKEKKAKIWVLVKLSGEDLDLYKLKNSYWSIIPKNTEPPEAPDCVSIHFKGSVQRKEDLLDSSSIANINYIRNRFTWSDVDDLFNKLQTTTSLFNATKEILELWINNLELLPSSQLKLPNYTETVAYSDGDILYVESDNLNYIWYNSEWNVLPVGLSQLRVIDNDQILTPLGIEFTENEADVIVQSNLLKSDSQVTYGDGGGHYCLTEQLQHSKFPEVDCDVFIYMYVKTKRPEEKKQKSCNKSSSCSKESSSCDKGQTDVADQHNPNINENWLNKILDLLIKIELHPMQLALIDLANAVIKLSSAITQTPCCESPGQVICPEANALGELVLSRITPRKQFMNGVLLPSGDDAVDIATSIVFNPIESAVNSAIDTAISSFNDIINNIMNDEATNTMDANDTNLATCTGENATNCVSNCRKSGNESMAKAVESAIDSCKETSIRALDNFNQACLSKSKQMLAEFSQKICDSRMKDTGSESALIEINKAIEEAKKIATEEAKKATSELCNSYRHEVEEICISLDNIVKQAYLILEA